MDFNLVIRACKHRRSAGWTKISAGVTVRVPCHRYRRVRINGGRVENSTVMLAAIHAMAQPDPQRRTRGDKAYGTAEAPACNMFHRPPLSVSASKPSALQHGRHDLIGWPVPIFKSLDIDNDLLAHFDPPLQRG